jgi:CRP-like cAMP-binding protein
MINRIQDFIVPAVRVLESMSPEDLAMFRTNLRLVKMKKGRELFREGTYPRAVYVIKRGKVKLLQRGQTGVETIVHIQGPGEILGYRPLLVGDKYPVSAETMEESAVYVLDAKHFLSVLHQSAGLSNLLLRALSHEFSVLVNKIGAFAQKSVKERTALSLLILREKYRNPQVKGEIEIGLSRHDLAAFVGTTIETIARILRRLREERIIATRGRKIVIRDEDALMRLAD